MHKSYDRRLDALLIAGILLIYFFCNLQKVIIPGSIFNQLQEHFGATALQITGLGSVFMYTYGFFQLSTGLLIDRFSGTRVLAAGMSIFTLGCLLSALPVSLGGMYAARLLAGLGASTIYLSMITEMARLCGSQFPFFVGLGAFCGYSGSVIGSAPFILLAEHYDWQNLLLILALLMLAVMLAFWVLSRKARLPEIRREHKFSLSSFIRPLRNTQNLYIMMFVGLIFGSYFSLQAIIGKKILEDFVGMSASGAGLVLTMMVLLAAVDGFIVTMLSRWAGNRKVLILRLAALLTVFSLSAALVAVGLGYRAHWYWWCIFMLLSAAGNSTPLAFVVTRDNNAPESLGTASSLVNCSPYVTVALLGNLIGFIMGRWETVGVAGKMCYPPQAYFAIFLLLLAMTGIGCLGTFRLQEKGRGRTA
ncbi:MAG: MFS transporter [Oligosphaeraceae bacterium]|nr:MFS transporter [Oligosphaeraceae bacterium]